MEYRSTEEEKEKKLKLTRRVSFLVTAEKWNEISYFSSLRRFNYMLKLARIIDSADFRRSLSIWRSFLFLNETPKSKLFQVLLTVEAILSIRNAHELTELTDLSLKSRRESYSAIFRTFHYTFMLRLAVRTSTTRYILGGEKWNGKKYWKRLQSCTRWTSDDQ